MRWALSVDAGGVWERLLDTDTPTIAREEHRTAPGTMLGTVVVHVAEQALGKAVDARTDYPWASCSTKATGALPFSGPTAAAIFGQILHQTPRCRPSRNPEVPPDSTAS